MIKKAITAVSVIAAFIFFGATAYAEGEAPTLTVTEEAGIYSCDTPGGRIENDSLSHVLFEIIDSAPSAVIYFNGISADEEIRIYGGTYTLKGELSLSEPMFLSGGADVTLDGFSLSLSGGALRQKNGTLKIYNSEIVSTGSVALVLDYSEESRAFMYSGVIESHGAEAAVELSQGALTVVGGRISSDGAFAVNNSASLLVGAEAEIIGGEYGIITDSAIGVSVDGESLKAPLSVMYSGELKKGQALALFYSATGKEQLSLFDKDGASVELRYFESAAFTDEKCFTAAYLPYQAVFISDGAELSRTELLEGEMLSRPSSPEKTGYNFLGWYLSESEYLFDAPMSGDLELEAAYRLIEPTFSLSGLSFSYDGSPRSLEIESLFHPLIGEGDFSFQWYKNGAQQSWQSSAVNISKVVDSGEYYCEITFCVNGDSVSITTPSVSVSVSKKRIPLPSAESYVSNMAYNGKKQSFFVENENYTGFGEGLNAGEYTVPLSLSDPENCEWESDSEAYIVFRILPHKIRVKVDSVRVFLFQSLPPVEYEILDGSFSWGDELTIKTEAVGNRYIAATDNPNYEIITEGGEIIYENRPSPGIMSFLMLAVLFVVMLVLLAVALSSERMRARIWLFWHGKTPIPLSTKPCHDAEKTDVTRSALDMSAERADTLISDKLAKALIRHSKDAVASRGKRRAAVSVDTLSENFSDGERVDLNSLKEKNLIPSDTSRLRVLARGSINKPLFVYANDFSLSAVKMIALTGGEAIKCRRAGKSRLNGRK